MTAARQASPCGRRGGTWSCRKESRDILPVFQKEMDEQKHKDYCYSG